MPDFTVRYEAGSRYSYALALKALVEHARESAEDFEVYPADLAMLEHAGLSVTGPDLAGVRKVLAEIPGLEEQTD